MGGQHAGVVPDGRQALVDLDAGRVVGGGEAELVAAPDDDAFGALGGESSCATILSTFSGRADDQIAT